MFVVPSRRPSLHWHLRLLTGDEYGCVQVLESPMTAKHLIISLGEKTFLALPKRGKIVEGHCLIMPLESVVSSRECDEDVYNEFTRFKKQLQAMFFATNKSEVRACL